MTVPPIGERYRGVDGRSGFLLRQAWLEVLGALEVVLRPHGLTGAQYGVISVLSRDPGASGAELARGSNISPQAISELLAGLERDGLVVRSPHPTHGRILQVNLTDEGRRRLDAARHDVDRLEKLIDKGYTKEQIALVREWLVTAAKRMVEAANSFPDS